MPWRSCKSLFLHCGDEAVFQVHYTSDDPFCADSALERDRRPLCPLPPPGEGPRPLFAPTDVSESHLSNSSLTNFSICSLFISSLVPSDSVILSKILPIVSLRFNFAFSMASNFTRTASIFE